MRYFLLAAFLFTALPAHAAIEETAASYYGRLMKSCEFTARETWRDYLLYAPNKRIDECCAESVQQMAKLGAKLAPSNRQCPSGTQINALKCTSSKNWCEPLK
jgi:hypothetical protein